LIWPIDLAYSTGLLIWSSTETRVDARNQQRRRGKGRFLVSRRFSVLELRPPAEQGDSAGRRMLQSRFCLENSMLDIAIRILDVRLGTEFALPNYATAGSAGLDLRAMVDAPTQLLPGSTTMVSSGLAIHLADAGYAALVVPRSGLGSKSGIVLGNLVGVIDSDYQGPLLMPLWNRSGEPFMLQPGERVAQLLIVPIAHARFRQVEQFVASERGQGGFGSTGSA